MTGSWRAGPTLGRPHKGRARGRAGQHDRGMLLLLFIIVPLVELALLIRVGAMLGLPLTVLIVIGTAILGSSLARQQGLSVMQRLQSELQAGRQPTDALIEGFMVFGAGLVLLLPGFLSDALGLLCLIPFTRQKILGVLKARLASQVGQGPVRVFRFGGSAAPFGGAPGGPPRAPGGPERQAPFGGIPGPGAGPPDPSVQDLPADAYEVRRDD